MKKWSLICILSALSMLGAFSIDAYLPSFSAIGNEFHVDRDVVGQSLTIYLVTFAFMMLFYGKLADAYGRKPVILWSVLGYWLGSTGAAIAPSFEYLLVCRAVQGLSAGAGSVVGRAIIRDAYPGRDGQAIMSYVTMVFSLAPAIAPVLGAQLEVHYGWRSIFIFLSVGSAVIAVAAWRFLAETLPEAERSPLVFKTVLYHYWEVISHRAFLLQAAGMAIAFAGLSSYITTAPEYIQDVLHLPVTAYGWLFIPIVIGLLVGSWSSAQLGGIIAPRKLIWYAYGIMFTAAVVNLLYVKIFAPAVPWAVVPAMFYMFGLALSLPAMTLSVLDLFPHARGMAASLQGFVQMGLFAMVAGFVAPLVRGKVESLAICLLTGCVVSMLLWLLGVRAAGGEISERSQVFDD